MKTKTVTRKSGLTPVKIEKIYRVAALRAWGTTYETKAKKTRNAKERREYTAKSRAFRASADKLARTYHFAKRAA